MEQRIRVRCKECGRLLLEVYVDVNIQTKCYKCQKKYNVLITKGIVKIEEINKKGSI